MYLKTKMNPKKWTDIVNIIVTNYRFPVITNTKLLITASLVLILSLGSFKIFQHYWSWPSVITILIIIVVATGSWLYLDNHLKKGLRQAFLKMPFDPISYYPFTAPEPLDTTTSDADKRDYAEVFNAFSKYTLIHPLYHNYEVLLETDDIYIFLSRFNNRAGRFIRTYAVTVLDKTPENMALIQSTRHLLALLAPVLEHYRYVSKHT